MKKIEKWIITMSCCVVLVVSACGGGASGNIINEETEVIERTNNEPVSIELTTIFTCEYPKQFKNERNKVLNHLKSTFQKKQEYVFLEEKGNGYKQTLSASTFVYYGKIDKGRPEGMGIIVSPSNGCYIPRYAGNFKDGKYSGYGMELGIDGIESEGEFKKGLLSGDVIIYHAVPFGGRRDLVGEEYWTYWNNVTKNSVRIDYPVLQPSVKYVGTYKSGNDKDKNCKLYFSPYQIDNTIGCYRRTVKGIYGTLQYEGGISGGIYTGKGKVYYPSGKLMYEGELKWGKRNGKGILYNEDGSVEYKGTFKNGDVK